MSGRAVLSDVGTLEVKTSDAAVTRPVQLESSKAANPLATAVVRANLANHILVSHTTSPVAVMVARPPLVAPAQGGSVAVLSTTSTAGAVSGTVAHAVRVPSTASAASADTIRPPNSVMCIVPVALPNVRVSGVAPIARLPTPGTDVRLPIQMLQAPRASSLERSKLSTTTVASFQPRPAIVGHASHPAPTPLAAVAAAGGMRALLPVNSSRPVALPIVRPPVVSIPGLTSWGTSTSGSSSSAPTIQIAIRPPHTDMASAGQPTATSTAGGPTTLQLGVPPERMILAAVTSADVRTGSYRSRAQLIVPTGLGATTSTASTPGFSSTVNACGGAGTAQTQAVNLVSKTKILLTHSSLPQKVSPSITSHLTGVQPVALNLSQSPARARMPVYPYVFPSALSAQSPASNVTSKPGATTGVPAAAQISAINVVTVARPTVAHQAQPPAVQTWYKSVATNLSSPAVPLQSPSQGSALLLGGSCNILSSGAVLSVEGLNARADRSTQILQPVQRDYTPQILTMPTGTRVAYEQPQSTPVAVVGQAQKPTLVVSQHSSALLNTSGKVAQVVVAMDPTRRTVQSAYVVDGGSISTAAGHHHQSVIQPSAEPAATTTQTIMSPRPSILRKRPHDVTPKKTNLLHVISAGGEHMTSSQSRPHPLMAAMASPFRPVDASRDNSQSSTDTASFSGSTQGSLPPSTEKIKLEPLEIVENGVMSNGQIDVPRKKPRKQLLHANEEMLPMPGFTSPGDDETVRTEPMEHHVARQKLRKQLEKVYDDSHNQEIAEFCDEDGVRFSMEDSHRRFPGGLVGSLHFAWKSRNNHFVSYSDLVPKEERRASVNELANSRRAHQRASGWPMHYFIDQLEQLRELETDVLDRLKASVPEEASDVHQSIRCKTTSGGDDGLHAVRELVLGNIQRCQQFVARLDEARGTLLSITETHRPRVADIIARHQSKRIVKKKERL